MALLPHPVYFWAQKETQPRVVLRSLPTAALGHVVDTSFIDAAPAAVQVLVADHPLAAPLPARCVFVQCGAGHGGRHTAWVDKAATPPTTAAGQWAEHVVALLAQCPVPLTSVLQLAAFIPARLGLRAPAAAYAEMILKAAALGDATTAGVLCQLSRTHCTAPAMAHDDTDVDVRAAMDSSSVAAVVTAAAERSTAAPLPLDVVLLLLGAVDEDTCLAAIDAAADADRVAAVWHGVPVVRPADRRAAFVAPGTLPLDRRDVASTPTVAEEAASWAAALATLRAWRPTGAGRQPVLLVVSAAPPRPLDPARRPFAPEDFVAANAAELAPVRVECVGLGPLHDARRLFAVAAAGRGRYHTCGLTTAVVRRQCDSTLTAARRTAALQVAVYVAPRARGGDNSVASVATAGSADGGRAAVPFETSALYRALDLPRVGGRLILCGVVDPGCVARCFARATADTAGLQWAATVYSYCPRTMAFTAAKLQPDLVVPGNPTTKAAGLLSTTEGWWDAVKTVRASLLYGPAPFNPARAWGTGLDGAVRAVSAKQHALLALLFARASSIAGAREEGADVVVPEELSPRALEAALLAALHAVSLAPAEPQVAASQAVGGRSALAALDPNALPSGKPASVPDFAPSAPSSRALVEPEVSAIPASSPPSVSTPSVPTLETTPRDGLPEPAPRPAVPPFSVPVAVPETQPPTPTPPPSPQRRSACDEDIVASVTVLAPGDTVGLEPAAPVDTAPLPQATTAELDADATAIVTAIDDSVSTMGSVPRPHRGGDLGLRATVSMVEPSDTGDGVRSALVDQRWLVFGPQCPTVSSVDAAVLRSAPGGTVQASSFSVAVDSLRHTHAYLRLEPLPVGARRDVVRKLFLFGVPEQGPAGPVAPQLAAATIAPDATEHCFERLPRGRQIVAVHVAARAPPPDPQTGAAPWISLDDVVVADGVEFVTPALVAEHPSVPELHATSAALAWSGNATAYVVSVEPVRGEDDSRQEEAGTHHLGVSAPSAMVTGLRPATLYMARIRPSVAAVVEEEPRPDMPVEECELVFCTGAAVDPAAVIAAAAPVDVLRVPVEAAVTLRIPCPAVAAGPYRAALRPAVAINGVPVESAGHEAADDSAHGLATDGGEALPSLRSRFEATVPLGCPVTVSVRYDVTVARRDSGVTVATGVVDDAAALTVGPFHVIHGLTTSELAPDGATLSWGSTASAFRVAVARIVGDATEDECTVVAAPGERTVRLHALLPDTVYRVVVTGERCLAPAAAELRTLPPAPERAAFTFTHDAITDAVTVQLPPSMVDRHAADDEAVDGTDDEHEHHDRTQLVARTTLYTATLQPCGTTVASVEGARAEAALPVVPHSAVSVEAVTHVLVGPGRVPLVSPPQVSHVVHDVRCDDTGPGRLRLRYVTRAPVVTLSLGEHVTQSSLSAVEQGEPQCTEHSAVVPAPAGAPLLVPLRFMGRDLVPSSTCRVVMAAPPALSPSLVRPELYETRAVLHLGQEGRAVARDVAGLAPAEWASFVSLEVVATSEAGAVALALDEFAAGRPLEVALLLNRGPNAALSLALRATFDAAAAAKAGVVCLNPRIMSTPAAVPCPAVHDITSLAVDGVTVSALSVKWRSICQDFLVAVIGPDGHAVQQRHTNQCRVRFTDLAPGTAYLVRVTSPQAGAHSAAIAVALPPAITGPRRVDPNASDDVSFLDGGAVPLRPELAELDAAHATLTLPPTAEQHVDTTVLAPDGTARPTRLRFDAETVLTLRSEPVVQWRSVPGEERRCDVVLWDGAAEWSRPLPHFTVHTRTTCDAAGIETPAQLSGEGDEDMAETTVLGPTDVLSPPPCDGPPIRVDVLARPEVEVAAPQLLSLKWLGSAREYEVTVFAGTASPEPIHREVREVAKWTWAGVAQYQGEALRVRVTSAGTPSNSLDFGVLVPAPPPAATVARHTPTLAVVTFRRPARSTTGVQSLLALKDGQGEVKRRVCIAPTDDEVPDSDVSVELPLEVSAKGESAAVTATLCRVLTPPEDGVSIVYLNSGATVEAKVQVPALCSLRGLRVTRVEAAAFEAAWDTTAAECQVTVTAFQPTAVPEGYDPATHDFELTAASLSQLPGAEGEGEGCAPGMRVHFVKRALVSRGTIAVRGLIPGAVARIEVKGQGCGDVILAGAVMTPPPFLDRSVSFRRQQDGATVSFDFEQEPLRYVVAGWHVAVTSELAVCSGDAAMETIPAAGQQTVHLTEPATRFVWRKSLAATPLSEGQGAAVAGLLRTDPSGAATVDAVEHSAGAPLWHALLTPTQSSETPLCEVPLLCQFANVALEAAAPQQAALRWDCAPPSAAYRVHVTSAGSLARHDRTGLGVGVTAPFTDGALSRVLTVDEPCVRLEGLSPSGLYEIAVSVDAEASVRRLCSSSVLHIADGAPAIAGVVRHFVTPPLRPHGHPSRRGPGTVTVVLNPDVDMAPCGLSRYTAVRAVPDNFIFVATPPGRAAQHRPPPAPKDRQLHSAKCTYVVTGATAPDLPGELQTATWRVKEPADTVTHCVEHYVVAEVSADSPHFPTTLNPVAWSEPDLEPVHLLRTVSHPQVAAVSSSRAELRWRASHDSLRFDIAVRPLGKGAEPEKLHRVADSRIALEDLRSGALHGATVTPSHGDVPCSPLRCLFLTAPRRPKVPKIHFAPLCATFDVPAVVATAPAVAPFATGDAASSAQCEVTTSMTAVVICSSDRDLRHCHTPADYLAAADPRTVFKSHPATAQRVEVRLRCAKRYTLAFFMTVHHPLATNGAVTSKVATVEHETQVFAPAALHVITRTKATITVGWASADVSRDTLHFQVAAYAMPPGLLAAYSKIAPVSPTDAGPKAEDGARLVALAMDQLDADDVVSQLVATAAAAPQLHATFHGLSGERHYAFRVRSVGPDGKGHSDWSLPVIATTLCPPRPVGAVRVTGVSPSTVCMEWDDAVNAATGDTMSYLVQYRPVDAPSRAGSAASSLRGDGRPTRTARTPPVPPSMRGGELLVHKPRCDIAGLLCGVQYRVTVVPQNQLGELCPEANTTTTVRTEGTPVWK